MPLWLPQTTFRRGQAIEVWGCVRPAHYAHIDTGREQMARIEFRRAAGGPFETVATVHPGRDCYFDTEHAFPGSGAVRVAWTYPHGPEIFSRTVRLTAR
jgi:hypothetical protein